MAHKPDAGRDGGGQPDVQQEMLTVEQVALKLNVSTNTVRRLADSGRMPRPHKIANCCRWHDKVVSEWLKAGCPRVDRRGGR